jgi:CRP/FNR family transcriptional regulator
MTRMRFFVDTHDRALGTFPEKMSELSASSNRSLTMTQSELAAHLGTSREVVARVLRRFVRAKYVQTSRGKIVIRQPDMLARII